MVLLLQIPVDVIREIVKGVPYEVIKEVEVHTPHTARVCRNDAVLARVRGAHRW